MRKGREWREIALKMEELPRNFNFPDGGGKIPQKAFQPGNIWTYKLELLPSFRLETISGLFFFFSGGWGGGMWSCQYKLPGRLSPILSLIQKLEKKQWNTPKFWILPTLSTSKENKNEFLLCSLFHSPFLRWPSSARKKIGTGMCQYKQRY